MNTLSGKDDKTKHYMGDMVVSEKTAYEYQSGYINGKGVYVGTFSEEDLNLGKDKEAVNEKIKETGLKYTNTEYVKKKGKIVGLKLYVCRLDDVTYDREISVDICSARREDTSLAHWGTYYECPKCGEIVRTPLAECPCCHTRFDID